MVCCELMENKFSQKEPEMGTLSVKALMKYEFIIEYVA